MRSWGVKSTLEVLSFYVGSSLLKLLSDVSPHKWVTELLKRGALFSSNGSELSVNPKLKSSSSSPSPWPSAPPDPLPD